jgi:hypothetical protein
VNERRMLGLMGDLGWVLLLWVLPTVVIAGALLLTLWQTHAMERQTSWPWFVFAFVSIAFGAVMWWFMGLALLAAVVMVVVGSVQLWRRRYRPVPVRDGRDAAARTR